MFDLRHAFRALRATPVVTIVAILSLALGIGANTAIFSVLDSLILRTLPVHRPEQLALLVSNPAGTLPAAASWSNPAWEQIRERRQRLFQTALAYSARPTRLNLASGVQTDLVDGIWVSGEYFQALGVEPMLGRAFIADDDRRGGGAEGPVAVISHGFWHRRFGGAGDVIGRTLLIERVPFTIVGVTPPGFFGAEVGSMFDIALPLGTEPLLRGRDSYLDRPTTALTDEVRRIPGVSHAGVSAITPVSGSVIDTVVEVENRAALPMPQNVSYRNVVTPDWFATYGTRLMAGRDFDDRDRAGAPLTVIVNQAFVTRFLDGRGPVGQRIRLGLPERQGPWLEVVGVVADAAYRSLREPAPPTLYVPLAQQKEPPPSMNLSVRAASGTPAALSRSLSDAVARVDRNIAVTFVPLKDQVDAALVQERLLAMLSGFFGSLALLLAGLGVYGMTWYAVSTRRTEIGIRMALGATRSNVARLVLGRLLLMMGLGVAAGAAIALPASKLVTTLLYQAGPRDVPTLIGSVALLAAAAALAGWIPAYRATRIDPARALRES